MGTSDTDVAGHVVEQAGRTLDVTAPPVVDMTDPDPSLQQVSRRRSELKAAMRALDTALAQVEDSEPAQWLSGVRDAVGRLVTAFEQHVNLHEGPDSFHAEVVRTQPHLASRVNRLQRDHVKLRASLDRLGTAVAEASTATVDEVGRLAKDVLHQFDVHRRRGAALVWEAFNYDLGGEH